MSATTGLYRAIFTGIAGTTQMQCAVASASRRIASTTVKPTVVNGSVIPLQIGG